MNPFGMNPIHGDLLRQQLPLLKMWQLRQICKKFQVKASTTKVKTAQRIVDSGNVALNITSFGLFGWKVQLTDGHHLTLRKKIVEAMVNGPSPWSKLLDTEIKLNTPQP